MPKTNYMFLLAFAACTAFAALAFAIYLIEIPAVLGEGRTITVFSHYFFKNHLARMFIALSSLSLLLLCTLAFFENTKKYALIIYLITSLIVANFYLVESHRKGAIFIKPYIKQSIQSIDPGFLVIPDIPFSNAEIRKMSSFASYTDAIETRSDLIRFIWKRDTLPLDAMPEQVERNITIVTSGQSGRPKTEHYQFSNLKHVDSIKIDMEHGFTSTAYHFVPEKSNNRLFIYHQGHHKEGFLKRGMKVITRLVEEGYAVLAFSMPATGINESPAKVNVGKYAWENREDQSTVDIHTSYRRLENPTFSPLKLYLHPLTVGLNYALSTYTYERVSMMGISGGGWTTTIYAALDTRIRSSYPVAGTLPAYLFEIYPNAILNDNTDNDPKGYEYGHEIFMDVGYLKLYVLGAVGKGRYRRQILNQFDRCCAKGVSAYSYAPYVSESVTSLGVGGNYSLAILPQMEHAIGEAALAVIFQDEGALD